MNIAHMSVAFSSDSIEDLFNADYEECNFLGIVVDKEGKNLEDKRFKSETYELYLFSFFSKRYRSPMIMVVKVLRGKTMEEWINEKTDPLEEVVLISKQYGRAQSLHEYSAIHGDFKDVDEHYYIGICSFIDPLACVYINAVNWADHTVESHSYILTKREAKSLKRMMEIPSKYGNTLDEVIHEYCVYFKDEIKKGKRRKPEYYKIPKFKKLGKEE